MSEYICVCVCVCVCVLAKYGYMQVWICAGMHKLLWVVLVVCVVWLSGLQQHIEYNLDEPRTFSVFPWCCN